MVTSDPTKIDIDFDPTVQRMRGVAVHGNKYFDVPFISQIDHNLYQGGCETGLVLPVNIKHVVSLYKWEQYKVAHELQSSLTVTMYDSLDGVNREQALALANWVNVCRKNAPVLVHCQAGLNRSSLIAGLALVLDGRTPEAAVELLREKRSDACLCNPVFEQWLRDFQV